jgi:hypothetical protein
MNNMLIYVGEPYNKIIVAEEGSGDNLSQQDIEDGYTDYFMTSLYKQDGDELVLVDSGQLLLPNLIKDTDERTLAYMLRDYWGVVGKNYKVLES